MSEQWHYSRDGQKLGPVDGNELRKLAAAGRLGPNDLIWRNGLPNWVPAGSISGLFSGPPPLPGAQASSPLPRRRGNKLLAVGIGVGLLLLVFIALQGMMNSHNRRRQDTIDFHRREAADALRRAEDGLRQLER